MLTRQTFLNGRRPGESDVLWLRPDGGEMTGADWNDASRRVLGMLLDGDAILESDARGQRIVGDTLLVLLNTGDTDVSFTLPARAGRTWTLQIDTMSASGAPGPVAVGDQWMLKGQSAAVFVASRLLTGSTARGPNRP